MLNLFYSPYIWQIKKHKGLSGNRYLLDMDIKPKWIVESIKQKGFKNVKLLKTQPLSWKDYSRVHGVNFVDKIVSGDSQELVKYSWITWSKSFLRAQKYIGGAIYEAGIYALKNKENAGALVVEGHHAKKNESSGFCTFHHLAVVIKKILLENKIDKIAVIDLDFHFGDGTVDLLGKDKRVGIFDIYGLQHKPSNLVKIKRDRSRFFKVKNKDQYFKVLNREILKFLDDFQLELVFIVSGVDVCVDDRYGGVIGMTKDQVCKRDELVFDILRKKKIPAVFTLGGGYVNYNSKDLGEIKKKRQKLVDLHLSTINSATNLNKNK